MKRNLIIISILSVAAISIAVASKVWIYQNDNTRLGFDYDKLDSITYVTPGTIALSVSEKNVPFEGGTFDLDVVASQPWTVSISDPNSVKVSQFAGAGNTTLKVVVAQNTNLSARTTTVKFTLQDGTPNTLNVITAPWQDKIELSVTKKNIGFEGGSFTIDVKSNISWSVSTNKTWVTLSKTKGEGNDNITVTVAPNNSATKDTAKVVFKTKNVVWANTFIYRDVENINVSPSSQDVSFLGGEVPINITSNTSWTVSSDKDWVTFSETQGSGNKTITATVAQNTTQAKGVATITVTTKYAKIPVTTKINRDVETISVSPTSYDIPYLGGEVSISVTSNTSWTISSDKDWVTLSRTSGTGDGIIDITVAENTTTKTEIAIVTLTTALGKIDSISIKSLGMEKCKASDYPQVTIGTQTWMAENYRCSKYDTESEAYKEGRYTVPTSESSDYTPYYTDASDKSKWYDTEYAGNLTNAQITKLGYLYNWAAAVGVADGEKQTTAFTGNRQGICPNGWHVPSRAEWHTLVDYIEKTDGKGAYTAGKHLKTTSGWYDAGKPQTYPQGLDTYGFAALPAGHAATRNYIHAVGDSTYLWTDTPHNSNNHNAYSTLLSCYHDFLLSGDYYYDNKILGQSVRCLKDDED